MNRISKTAVILVALLAAVAATAQPRFRWNREKPQPQYALDRVDGSIAGEEILRYKGFTVSYSPARLIPNWVAWELTAEEASATAASRTDEFLPDPAARVRQPDTQDYSNSGFDRGHMAAAADMKWDAQAMAESFYLTNICPQNRQLNAGLWLELEQKCRYWAKKNGRVWIVCGPMTTTGHYSPIGEAGVTVPDAFFKCVCMCVDGRWTCAAFVFPNLECTGELTRYIFPVISVEAVTGLGLFNDLPLDAAQIQSLKINPDSADWEIPGWKKR